QVLDNYPSKDDGVLEHWCLRFFEVPPAAAPPPVESLDCATTSDGAALTWANTGSYEAIYIRLDDELSESLPGSATSFTIDSRPPGTKIVADVEGVVSGSAPSCPKSCSFVPLGTLPYPLTEKLVLVVIDGLRYTEGLGDPLRQHVPEMDALTAQGTIVEPFINDYCTETKCAIPAIMNGSWIPTYDPFFDPECQQENQHSRIPYVHEYFRRQLNRPAADCVYVLGPYCPWRPSYLPTYGPAYWPETVATSGGDDANWAAAQSILETQRPTFLTLYLPEVDSAGHSGNWTTYINAIENADRIVGELWAWLQQDPDYAGSTTLVVTNDHGRHTDNFRGHGDQCDGCRTIQLLAVGPGIRAGCVSNVQRTIPDIAPTIAALLGFQTEFASGEIMTEILSYGCDDTPSYCGDIDESGGPVDLGDFGTFAVCYGLDTPYPPDCDTRAFCSSDLDGNGIVNLNDFGLFALWYGLTPTQTVPNCTR
ncbi:MAG: alkaline phosphatase family protein, partial [Phycisphaerales bacterium]